MGRNGYLLILALGATAAAGCGILFKFGPINSSQERTQDQVLVSETVPKGEETFLSSSEFDKLTEEYRAQGREQRETPVTQQMIASLEDSDLDDRIWSRLLNRYSIDETSLATAPKEVRAYLATREFEWEFGNGGLFQYFHNYPSDQLLAQVIEGYSLLQLPESRKTLEEVIWPIAKSEAAWSATLQGPDDFSAGYAKSKLPQFDHLVTFHDAERIKFVRAHPELFEG